MILYFTGTGNTKFLAEYLSDSINDDCLSLNDIMKHRKPLIFHSEKPFVIAAPIYAWRYPRIIEKLVRKADFSGSKSIYFLATMESQTGNCEKYLKEIADEKGMTYCGFCGVSMPGNLTVGKNLETKEEAELHIADSMPLMQRLAEQIAVGEEISKSENMPFGSVASSAVNIIADSFVSLGKFFSVSKNCVSCGKCRKVCPSNNIIMQDGKPFFREKCLNCCACINKCPTRAINLGGLTQNTNRYVCPEYSEWKKKYSDD